ncbi:MAG: pyridoxamine 5'-phosphate oxidase [Opitutales bacterium TMED158]|nr:MAG: pyridoxamine 5'-phosphate oxidase [Opitutales bacterium TMED158]
MPDDISQLREDYTGGSLRRKDLDPDPIAQFRIWFGQAQELQVIEPNALTLATVDAEGQPWQRSVLLKAYDERGFVFFTNFESRKARHIDGSNQVSALFPWFSIHRQVAITGRATKISSAESLKYFVTRPLGSRIGAWASKQSSVITSRSLLEAKLDEMKRKFKSGDVPLPSFWGGFRIEPKTIEFWQGGGDRVHDRFLYSIDGDNNWGVERLSP